MYYFFDRVSFQSTISIKFKCRQRNQKHPVEHAASAAKNSQKKEENASVAQRVITKHATSVTRRLSQAKE
jgi:hypothetical protein